MPTKNWPHPVLDAETGDYPNCAFQARLKVRQTKLDYKIQAEFDLGCDSLDKYIASGNAAFIIQLSCASTAFRRVFSANEPLIDVAVPEHDLRDVFAISPYIVSTSTIELSTHELAPTFEGLTFAVRRGAVLAAAPSAEYVAEKVFDELKNISAIFEVIKHFDQHNSAIDYDLNRNKIAILLPHKVYEDYRIFRGRTPYREMFVCSLVLPGLAMAIEALGPADSDVADALRWRRALRRKLHLIDRDEFNREDCFKIAQELLEYPYSRAFQAISIAESAES
jgi:hypothetical protein